MIPWRYFFSLNGRVTRAQYWLDYHLSFVACVVVLVKLSILVGDPEESGWNLVWVLAILATFVFVFWFRLAMSVKRWHDRDKSGWWILINVIPLFGNLWALVEQGFLEGTRGPNRFGPDPLDRASADVPKEAADFESRLVGVRMMLAVLAVLAVVTLPDAESVAEGARVGGVTGPFTLDVLVEPAPRGDAAMRTFPVQVHLPGFPSARTGGWCAEGQAEALRFQTENGKTVSICEDDGVLTCSYGRLDGEPELRYSGRVLAYIDMTAVDVGSEVSEVSLAELADDRVSDPETNELLRELSDAPTTDGFVVLNGLTGFTSSVRYIFRNGGWQYEVSATWGRTFNVEEGSEEYKSLANYEEYGITVFED